MTPQHERQLSPRRTSIVAALLAVATAMAAEPTSRPAKAPNAAPAADPHDPTIKDAYKDHFLIGMAGDLPGRYSDQEMGVKRQLFFPSDDN
jgi:hypothetical protein